MILSHSVTSAARGEIASMPPNVSQIDWVRDVLVVSFGQRGRDTAASSDNLALDVGAARNALVAARDEMTAALTKADAQVRKLQAVLAVHPDIQLQEIAGSPDMGINALTGGFRVRVLAALRDLETAPEDKLPAVVKKARGIVTGFDNHITSSDRIEACDLNPLGIA